MRKSQCRGAFWTALIVAGCLSSLFAYGQIPTSGRGVQDASSPAASVGQPGPYHALLIGNNNYRYLPKLQTSVNDANAVAQLLRERYGFQTEVLLDADRDQILTALIEYRRSLPENSNLLIYYAGHGHHDRDADEAYWLPIDAQADNNANWISADDITRDVRAMRSSHVLVISDSCYSGYLARTVNATINPKGRAAILARAVQSKSRTLLSSGGDEPVADSGAPGHSVFAWAILESLRQIDDDQFTADDLFNNFIHPGVAGQSNQEPHYSELRDSGHQWGDFVFSRQPVVRSSTSGGEAAKVEGTEITVAVPNTAPSTVNLSKSAAAGSPATGKLSRSQSIAGWAVGDKGTILHTEDGGRSWKPQSSGTSLELCSVAFATPQSGWAVGLWGTILHTEDRGGSWHPQSSGTSANLISIAFATPQSGWAVGHKGTILHTEDGGRSWKPQSSGTSADLMSVAFATPRLGWAVGWQGIILHTEDAGSTWQEQSSGTSANLISIAFATLQSGWAVGHEGAILHTEDGGSTWRPQSSGTSAQLVSVTFVTPQSGWAVGRDMNNFLDGNVSPILMTTGDGGRAWKAQSNGTDEFFSSIAFATPQSGWAVGSNGAILHTDDGGRTWQPQSSGTEEELQAIAFLKP